MRFFGGNEARNAAARINVRTPRASSGWSALLKSLRESDGQRVLDIGPTSSTNINFLTSLGHSVYMADLVAEARDPRWAKSDPEAGFPTTEFLSENLNFSGRHFDTVLLWDSSDYLQADLRTAVIERIQQVLEPGGQLLAFFHTKPDNELHRYHLRDDNQIDVQYISEHDAGSALNNRQIEQLFAGFGGYRFFLAKDNLREVLVTR